MWLNRLTGYVKFRIKVSMVSKSIKLGEDFKYDVGLKFRHSYQFLYHFSWLMWPFCKKNTFSHISLTVKNLRLI